MQCVLTFAETEALKSLLYPAIHIKRVYVSETPMSIHTTQSNQLLYVSMVK